MTEIVKVERRELCSLLGIIEAVFQLLHGSP
jgi:hypothetical protein